MIIHYYLPVLEVLIGMTAAAAEILKYAYERTESN